MESSNSKSIVVADENEDMNVDLDMDVDMNADTDMADTDTDMADTDTDMADTDMSADSPASESIYSKITTYVTALIGYLGVATSFITSSTTYNVLRVVGIIIILSFIIINIFKINFYGYINDIIKSMIDYFLSLSNYIGFGKNEISTSNTSVETSTVTKDVTDKSSKKIVPGVDVLEKGLYSNNVSINKIDDDSKIDMELLNRVAKKKVITKQRQPLPDDAGSRTQSNKYRIKSGFCYIGEDRGFRRCIEVGEGDNCMSGDIFPTDEICVNPNLRE